MKKTIALTTMTMTALALVKAATAENRIQYSMEDAAEAANKKANTFTWTFSAKTSRADDTVDASTPTSASGGASGGESSPNVPVSNWNEDGTNKITGTMYDPEGFNQEGVDATGHRAEDYGENGWSEDGYFKGGGYYATHENPSLEDVHLYDEGASFAGLYDDDGYDVNGYDVYGYDRNGNEYCNRDHGCGYGCWGCAGSRDYYPAHITSDGAYFDPYVQCFTADTLIALADGSSKRAEEVSYDDELMVWNFDEGKFDHAKPIWIKVPEVADKYNYLRFSDGSVLKTINQHRIFNVEAGKFTYPMTDETPVGTHTLNAKGELVTLVEKKVVEEKVTYYNIITYHHLNCFAGSVLTSCRLNNLYPIKDLKFVKDDRKLTPYEEFSKLDRKWYDGLRLSEQPKDVNRDHADDHGDKSLEDYALRLIKIMKA